MARAAATRASHSGPARRRVNGQELGKRGRSKNVLFALSMVSLCCVALNNFRICELYPSLSSSILNDDTPEPARQAFSYSATHVFGDAREGAKNDKERNKIMTNHNNRPPLSHTWLLDKNDYVSSHSEKLTIPRIINKIYF